ncbi:hypothetical protein VTG60DRAFT_5261 [Thermothelomyces hinnuleus]
MPPKTSPQTEKSELDGANESQDTLLVAHRLMMDFGVCLVRTVSAPGDLATLVIGRCRGAVLLHQQKRYPSLLPVEAALPATQPGRAVQSRFASAPIRKRRGVRASISPSNVGVRRCQNPKTLVFQRVFRVLMSDQTGMFRMRATLRAT